MRVSIAVVIGLILYLAITAAVVYVLILIIKALRKYIRSAPAREER